MSFNFTAGRFKAWADDGTQLAGGRLYTYSSGTTTFKAAYTDSTLGTPCTYVNDGLGGLYIALDARGEADVWFGVGAYSFKLTDSAGLVIDTGDGQRDPSDTAKDYTDALRTDLASSSVGKGSKLVAFIQRLTGAVATWVEDKLAETVSVKDFGAKGDGVTDDTNAFDNAIASLKRVYVPAGTYLVNATINNKTIIYGDGSFATILKPYNTALAIMTYAISVGDFYYHSEVRDLSFRGTGKVGVGFTFGQTVPASYVSGNENAHNVKFYGVYFTGLNKGIQFPYGNIGTEFYSCSWGGNFYGIYTLNAKFGGTMHAGLKYLFGGYFGSNDCGIYYHNAIDGGGGMSLYGVTFEGNKIGAYVYTTAHPYTPIQWNDTWFETNGTYNGGTSTIDSWSGTTLSTQVLTNRTVIIDGDRAMHNFYGGFLTDMYVKATDSFVNFVNARVESSVAVLGGPFTVDTTSTIRADNCYTSNGIRGDGLITTGMFSPGNFLADNTAPSSRSVIIKPRSAKITSYGPSRVSSDPYTVSRTTLGNAAIVGSVVSDGVIYSTCNEWTTVTDQTVYTALTSNSLVNGNWYVATVDIKITAGSPAFSIDDQGTNILSNINIPTVGKWYTIGVLGKAAATATQALWVTTGANATWRLSAFQIHEFSSRLEAQQFLESGAYAES